MDELLLAYGIAGPAADHLHRLVADWQLLADLSFADLVLFVPAGESGSWVAAAQLRPTTGPTVYQDDLVGRTITAAERPQLAVAAAERRVSREGDPVWLDSVPVREEAIPVVHDGRVAAVIARDTNLTAARTPSQLEITYLRSANDLAQMVAQGAWPYPVADDADDAVSGPRVGDGLVRLDAAGTVSFASPNALSAYRRLGHLGDLVGARLEAVTAEFGGETAAKVAGGRRPRSGEVDSGDTVVQLRALPLRRDAQHVGALVLVHDVTELRRRERALVGKDATIREIHHRVKNNLQTVAALLRLQARRMVVPEARDALEDSVRRVSTIAVVHETLSGSLDESVDFDAVSDRIAGLVADVASGGSVRPRRSGSFGVLPAEIATPLAMVLTELVSNAVEHGLAGRADGTVEIVVAAAGPGQLTVTVRDDGCGLPAGFSLATCDRLGLQIVRTLVESALGGRLRVEPAPGGGTAATLTFAV